MTTDLTEKIKLDLQTDRRLIPAGQPCERYLLVVLQAPERPPQTSEVERSPLNLSLVIDRSGSMSGEKLEYVKQAAVHALRLLVERDRVSVVLYDDEVRLLAPSQLVTPAARADLTRQIQAVQPGGMTNLSGGWFTGCDQIANAMTPDYLNRALLLTDGLANQGLTDHEQLVHQAKELRRRGISTTTFGVGNDFNQFLLQGIADAGGGHFYFIDSPAQIPNYFQGELGELLTTVAREMTLEIGLPAGVEADLLNEIPTEAQPTGLRIFLGDTYANETRLLVLKLKLPPQLTSQNVFLTAVLRYADAQHRPVVISAETVQFSPAEPGACGQEVANEKVLAEAGRLEAERAKMEALRKEYSGDVTGAQAGLRRAREVLRAMPAPMAAPLSADLQAMEEKMAKGLNPEERKQAHYATYRAQRSRKDYKK